MGHPAATVMLALVMLVAARMAGERQPPMAQLAGPAWWMARGWGWPQPAWASSPQLTRTSSERSSSGIKVRVYRGNANEERFG